MVPNSIKCKSGIAIYDMTYALSRNSEKNFNRLNKAIRIELLFDIERGNLFRFLEDDKIWYVPLKGLVLKSYYSNIIVISKIKLVIRLSSGYCKNLIRVYN